MAGTRSSMSEHQREVFSVNNRNIDWFNGPSVRSLKMRAASIFTLAYSFCARAHAAAAGTLPWERPMTAIATSLTGPVAYAIGLIGIALVGGAMLGGGELTEFGLRACMIGLVVSVLVSRPRCCRVRSALR